MKRIKQILCAVMAVIMAATLGVTAFAAQNEGSITICDTVQGKPYELYKVFDLTYDGDRVAYTVAEGWTDFFAPGGAGKSYIADTNSGDLNAIVVNGKVRYINITEDNVADFAQTAMTYAVTKTPDAQAVGNGGKVTAIGLDLGYYLVYPKGASVQNANSTGSICSLTSAKPAATVYIKADYPTIDKQINENGGVDTNTASIGDSIPYVITGEVPDMTGYDKFYYIVTDTMSKGLTYNEDMAITLDGASLTANTHYTVTSSAAGGKTVLEIVFKNFIDWQNKAGKEIKLTYSATLNQDAAIGTDPNTNQVILNYSNDPHNNPQGDPDDPDTPVPGSVIGETPKIITNTYVTQIELTKVDGQDTTRTLTGAKFSISGSSKRVVLVNGEIYQADKNGTYYCLKDGTYTETPPVTAPEGYTADLYDSTTVTYSKVTAITKENADLAAIVSEGYVGADGKLCFTGLGEGTYTVTELVAPDGYNLLTAPVSVTVVYDVKNGVWKYTVGEGQQQTSADGTVRFLVENNSGSALPGTGGTGTTILYIIGSLLVLIATTVLLIIIKSKKEE